MRESRVAYHELHVALETSRDLGMGVLLLLFGFYDAEECGGSSSRGATCFVTSEINVARLYRRMGRALLMLLVLWCDDC